MFQIPDYSHNVSLSLSEVLDDIGVNEKIVMKTRRCLMLRESMFSISNKLTVDNVTTYLLGSSSEGSTTLGLKSDLDVLTCKHDCNVIQDWSEWKQGMCNLLMIQDETTTPGYCFLQLLRNDEPLPFTYCPYDCYITDRRGRILMKNTILNAADIGCQQHGPSCSVPGVEGYTDKDFVIAFPCKSWPLSATGWLDRHGIGRWPTQDMKEYAVRNGCFVVPVGSNVSAYRDLEWRISTSLAERCLMFNLNITQIRCYVLMKMVLKNCLNPRGGNNLSSFMCKTVLLHCIQNTESNTWKENNLLSCVTYCLLELYNCIQNERCSHFIISENNVMAGQFPDEVKHQILVKLSDFIHSYEQSLLQIQIDDLGRRLQNKVNGFPELAYYCRFSSNKIILVALNLKLATDICCNHVQFLTNFYENLKRRTKQHIYTIIQYSKKCSVLERTACKLLLPLLCTTLGTSLASSSVEQNQTLTPEALEWLSAGLNSDVLSSRLKLASVFYCAGYMKKTEFILRHAEVLYRSNQVLPVCSCLRHHPYDMSEELMGILSGQNEDCIHNVLTYCVRFLQSELNCVPRELQYEVFRYTQEDLIHRHIIFDKWMDWVVVDSLPYHYFLQYKTYGQLQRYQDQQEALSNLMTTIETEPNLFHRETALNLLGQCMEQENKPREALRCYMLSLDERANNNAAKFHTCRLLAKILSQT